MTAPMIGQAKVLQGTNPTLLARALAPDGTALTQAAITSIAYKTYDTAAPTVEIGTGALDKTAVIFDTLQTDDRWTQDSTGYNFAWTVPTANAPNAGLTYRVEVTIAVTTAGAGNVLLIWNLEIVDALSVADV